MNCYIHTDRTEIVGTCVGCGRFICQECNTVIQSKNYCKGCVAKTVSQQNFQQQNNIVNSPKSKGTAIVLALFLGGLGIHKFYLNKSGQGILYLLFCWTLIPALIAIIDIIIYLSMDEITFNRTYGVVRY